MKKILTLIIVVFCCLCSLYGKTTKSETLTLRYYNYFMLTLEPLIESDLSHIEPVKYQISEKEERKILRYLKHKKVVQYIDCSMELDLSVLNDDFTINTKKTGHKQVEEKKLEQIDDKSINVRFVAEFGDHKLVLGRSTGCLRFDGVYYYIPKSEYKRLIDMFLKLTKEGHF